jgi:serine/threonine-protein kinase PpkA
MHALAAATVSARRHVASYRLERLLGQGRHGGVYLAVQPEQRCWVALKLAAAAQPPAGTLTLADEAGVLGALAHGNVVRVLEQGVADGRAFLAMEYAAGLSLAQLAFPIGPVRALSLFGQAAAALAWIHERGWVHRDIKPANLLLRADGTLVLGDFGSAARQGARSAVPPGTVVGTPLYAAPEQSDGAAADPAADVYSLGACLYEALSGTPLYPGQTLTELRGQHLLAPVPRLAPEQAAWQPLLDAMLAKNPRERLPDGQAVLARLAQVRHIQFPQQDQRESP